MMMATLLATVHMRPAVDENGAEMEISQEFKGSGRSYVLLLKSAASGGSQLYKLT